MGKYSRQPHRHRICYHPSLNISVAGLLLSGLSSVTELNAMQVHESAVEGCAVFGFDQDSQNSHVFCLLSAAKVARKLQSHCLEAD